jgi:sortase A
MSVGRGFLLSAIAAVAALSVWFLFYAFVLTPFEEARAQTVNYGTLRESLALQTAPIGGQIKPGTPIILLDSKPLGFSGTVVVEGTASGDLMNGPGHLRSTVLPGQMGTSVIMGRAAMFGGPFNKVPEAKVGDTLSVTTGQGVFTYTVESVRKAKSPLPQPLEAGKGRLTLITAIGEGRLGAWKPTGLIYVDAKLSGDAQQYPPGRPLLVPQAELPLQGDPSALLPLALALPLLIGAVIFGIWARTRWGVWQAWLVAVPLVLACVWAVSQAEVQLLPNLL